MDRQRRAPDWKQVSWFHQTIRTTYCHRCQSLDDSKRKASGEVDILRNSKHAYHSERHSPNARDGARDCRSTINGKPLRPALKKPTYIWGPGLPDVSTADVKVSKSVTVVPCAVVLITLLPVVVIVVLIMGLLVTFRGVILYLPQSRQPGRVLLLGGGGGGGGEDGEG